MQIWASLFKTSQRAANKWTAVERLEQWQPVQETAWQKTSWFEPFGRDCSAGKLIFYNERKKGFTSPDLFLLPPPSSPNHSMVLCSRTSNQIRATWLQTQSDARKMQIKSLKHILSQKHDSCASECFSPFGCAALTDIEQSEKY